jgi:serine/threonine protein kinase
VAQALGRAHELGVIHRDIKPDNIYLLSGYATDFVKLLDFGLAQMKGELRVTATGTVFGTPEYIAPEQARGAPLTHACDLYALGCVLFEMLTSELPFQGSTSELVLAHLRTPPPHPVEPWGERAARAGRAHLAAPLEAARGAPPERLCAGR